VLLETEPHQPTAVGVAGLGTGAFELALRPLDGDDVVRALAGFCAPAAWQAFGIVAPARAQPLDTDDPPRPVVLAVFADRNGHRLDALKGFHGPGIVPGEGEGRLLDACRRVLGLPTPAVEHRVALWLAFDWLDRTLAAVLAADIGEPPDWPTIAALDPGPMYAGLSWAQLRHGCASGALAVLGVDPVGAEWMDDGMFSREAIAAYPPLLELLHDLSELLPTASYDLLLTAVAARLSARSPS
jgi:hypothetical protein